MDSYIAGLLEERERVLRAGLSHRVAQVDAELKRVGYEQERPKRKKTSRRKTAVERADAAAPEQTVEPRPVRRPSQ